MCLSERPLGMTVQTFWTSCLKSSHTQACCTAQTSAFGFFVLFCVSLKNPRNHGAELVLQLLASRRVFQFNAFTFAANQPSFPKNLEMLGQRGLGKRQF